MSLEKIVAGDYGQVIRLTVYDVDTGTAANLSIYTGTVSVILTSPAGVQTVKTAAFSGDGSDGVVVYTLAEGDIDAEGQWQIQARVTNEGAQLTSEAEVFTVLAGYTAEEES